MKREPLHLPLADAGLAQSTASAAQTAAGSTAIVAAAFCLVVAVLLMLTYLADRSRSGQGPSPVRSAWGCACRPWRWSPPALPRRALQSA